MARVVQRFFWCARCSRLWDESGIVTAPPVGLWRTIEMDRCAICEYAKNKQFDREEADWRDAGCPK